MTKRACCIFACAFFLGSLPSVSPRIWAQEAEEQSTAQKNTTQKSAEKETMQMTDADLPADKRKELARVIRVFYLPTISTPTDLQDCVNALRTILEIQRVQQIPSGNAIIVRGTAEQVALSEKILDDITQDRKKAEGEYRLELKINELDDEKKLNSRTYSLLAKGHEVSRLRIGSRLPIHGNDKEIYIDVGKNIDCRIWTESEHSMGLRLTVEVSGVAEHGAAEPERSDPVIQQSKIETSSLLELGKPVMVSSFYDSSSKHTVQIEVTATHAK
jgi:type II secretory pathway component GspD/PulD (secretin)